MGTLLWDQCILSQRWYSTTSLAIQSNLFHLLIQSTYKKWAISAARRGVGELIIRSGSKGARSWFMPSYQRPKSTFLKISKYDIDHLSMDQWFNVCLCFNPVLLRWAIQSLLCVQVRDRSVIFEPSFGLLQFFLNTKDCVCARQTTSQSRQLGHFSDGIQVTSW